MIEGVDHVPLAMPAGGEAAAREFYAGVLGLGEIAKPDALAGRGGVWFTAGAMGVHLGVDPAFTPARKAHPAFVVPDLDVARERLVSRGFDCADDVPLPGVRRFFTADPFGNRIEIVTRAVG